MRFVITGEWAKNRLLQLIIVLFVVYVAILWLTNALLYFQKMGLNYTSVTEYYLGSEEKYLPPPVRRPPWFALSEPSRAVAIKAVDYFVLCQIQV